LGGKFEARETPEECVIREVLEESGLSIRKPNYCGLLLFTNFKGNDWYIFVFTATKFTGELIVSPEGKLEWISDDKLLDLNLWESDHIFFRGSTKKYSFPRSSDMTGARYKATTWSFIRIVTDRIALKIQHESSRSA
jgi:8-oxo-dGTP diphosphatase